MTKSHKLFIFIVVFLALTAGNSFLSAQETASQEKKVLTLEDYIKWKRIEYSSISPDGNWVTFAYRPNDGDATLYVKNLVSEKIYEIPNAKQPVFSEDSLWAAYLIDLSKDKAEALRKEKKPVLSKAELLNLETGDKYSVDGAGSFSFAENSKYFAVKKVKTDREAKHSGTDLILRDLDSGAVINIGNVAEFGFNKKGTYLAFTVDADKKAGNGVQLRQLAAGTIRVLDSGEASYTQLTWNEDGSAMAVLKGTENEEFVRKVNSLFIYTEIGNKDMGSLSFNPAENDRFPEGFVISELGNLNWSKDGSKIFLGIKEQEKKEESSKDKVANVDVWHWKDEQIQSVQMRRASRDRNFTFSAVYHLQNGKFVRLADETMRSVTAPGNGNWGLGRDDKPYILQLDLSSGKADYYYVNTTTGEKTLIEKKIGRSLGQSPDGLHFLYLKDRELWVHSFKTGEKTHLTNGKLGFFVNEDDDHQYDEKPGYRPAGWTKDGEAVIISHKFDLYLLTLDGTRVDKITKGIGEKEDIRFGYIRLDPEERFIDTSKPLLLSAYGEWTKKAGFYSLKVGGVPKVLVFDDKSFGRPQKAKNADKLLLTRQTFVEFPDYYVSGMDFKNLDKITDANPQQTEYAWGRRILIDYESTKGTKLQATLALPAGYEEGKRYPMLVYFYEKMSQRHHQYSMPTYDDRPHMSTYASSGYLVLMPDIVYANGTPGSNSMECTLPAVEKVIELGYADAEHIGLQGHSWGGYESSFALTQTDIFACVVTGAPLTNMISMYNILYKRTGNTNQALIEFGQGRMGATPWSDLDLYVSQSPVHHADKINTPFLILHGTEDGAVDWNQGLEFYTAARRLGKKVILLSYPGEPHHLTILENQKDFQMRMKQFFDHYLMDKPAPDWMADGIPFLKKKGGN
ncbi:prolyl oligopeptidase family serine peptidase [Acidobacteriota bacterium]